MSLKQITETLCKDLALLEFAPPVTHVYNPLVYAREAWDMYCDKYGQGEREVLLLGMNPGPFGMGQVGVPFGEVAHVRDWLGIETPIGHPSPEHPKRPVQGFHCTRSEVSGRRFWDWAQSTYKTPEAFFSRFFVANYCPLVFMEHSGRNRTPDKLPKGERAPLFNACDLALRSTVEHFQPRFVIGVGKFAEKRIQTALAGNPDLVTGSVPHPSPANPQANKGWAALMDRAMTELGVVV